MNANKQWGLRLKQARLAKGWSQKHLGMQAGLDEFIASTRINRYELGVHKADLLIAKNLAKVLGISVAFLYATDDEVAALLFRYGKAKKAERAQIQKLLEHIPMPPTPSD